MGFLMSETGSADADSSAAGVASAAARLVDELGTPSIGEAVLAFLRTQAFFDSALILSYQQNRRPRVLTEALAHPLRSNDVESYLAGAYLLDPFRMYAQTLRKPAVLRLQDITSEDFRSSKYFQTYYFASHLADEVNFLIPVASGQTLAVGLGRSQPLAMFADAEIERFRNWLPLISTLLVRHVEMSETAEVAGSGPISDREHDRLEARLAKFGAACLTPREHEVVQYLLRGSSAPDIAGSLSLSLQTVRVHRRNIYEKLEVSSLGQLFTLAMHTLLSKDT